MSKFVSTFSMAAVTDEQFSVQKINVKTVKKCQKNQNYFTVNVYDKLGNWMGGRISCRH